MSKPFFQSEPGCRPVARRYRRISQANWWYAQQRAEITKDVHSNATTVVTSEPQKPFSNIPSWPENGPLSEKAGSNCASGQNPLVLGPLSGLFRPGPGCS